MEDMLEVLTEQEERAYKRITHIRKMLAIIYRSNRGLGKYKISDNERAKHSMNLRVATWDLEDNDYSVKRYEESDKDRIEMKEIIKHVKNKLNKAKRR